MGERINIQNLIDLLADKKGLSKKEAERFLKEMFNLVEEALEKEQYLKIKGFGTFKLIAVDSRESVNVNTGERIEIQGHTKISFTPEAALRDQINRPFAHFETVILNEETVFEDLSQTDEMPELGDDSVFVTEEDQTELREPKEVEEEQITEETLNVDETLEPNIQDVPESIVSPESETKNQEELITPENQEENSTSEHDEQVVPIVEILDSLIDNKETQERTDNLLNNDQEVDKEENQPLNIEELISEAKAQSESSNKYGRDYSLVYLIVVVLFIIVFLGGVFAYIYSPNFVMNILSDPQQTEQQINATTVKNDSINRINRQIQDSLALLKEEEEKIKNDTTTTIISGVDELNASLQPDSTRYKIVGTMEKYTVKAGDGLMKISKHFYETKNLWPYIVKFNPKIKKSPNSVAQGTILFIPALRDKK